MKKSIGAKTLLFPTPVLMVGTYDKAGKPNLMVSAWGGICCSQPPCVAVALSKATYSYNCIVERKHSLWGLLARTRWLKPITAVLRRAAIWTSLWSYKDTWYTELRFPLLQRTLATIYGVSENIIEVGVHELDGSFLRSRKYSSRKIDAAVTEFKRLGSSIHAFQTT